MNWLSLRNNRVEAQDLRKTTHHFTGIYEILLKLLNKTRKVATCNRLDLDFDPYIVPKNLRGHLFHRLQLPKRTLNLVRGGSTRGNHAPQITNNGRTHSRRRGQGWSTCPMLRRRWRCPSKYLKSCLRRTECVPAFEALDSSQLMELVATVTAARQAWSLLHHRHHKAST